MYPLGFPDSSVDKESACNAGDPGSIPGLGRSTRKGIGYPVQYCWASLVAQLVKNPPAMQDIWVLSLGWKILWRRERLPSPVFSPGEFHGLSMESHRVGHVWASFHVHIPLTQFLKMVMLASFKTAVSAISPPGHWHGCSQDAGCFHPHKGPSCPFLATPTAFPPSPHSLPWLIFYPWQSRIRFLNVTFGIVDFFFHLA